MLDLEHGAFPRRDRGGPGASPSRRRPGRGGQPSHSFAFLRSRVNGVSDGPSPSPASCKESLEGGPAFLERKRQKRLAGLLQQTVEEDQTGGRIARQALDAAGSGMKSHLQGVERQRFRRWGGRALRRARSALRESERRFATTFGKNRDSDLPDFALISTSSPALNARQRNPSHLGSNCQPGPSGGFRRSGLPLDGATMEGRANPGLLRDSERRLHCAKTIYRAPLRGQSSKQTACVPQSSEQSLVQLKEAGRPGRCPRLRLRSGYFVMAGLMIEAAATGTSFTISSRASPSDVADRSDRAHGDEVRSFGCARSSTNQNPTTIGTLVRRRRTAAPRSVRAR